MKLQPVAMVKRHGFAVALSLAAALPIPSWACGACVEDTIAATYDHGVIHAAIERRQQVVFVALAGRDAARIGDRIAAAAPGVRGVQAGTLRIAVSPPAFSFALDARQPPEAAVAGFRKAVKGAAVGMTLVRVMRDGALVEPR